MRFLVTGGAGFLGSHLCERLIGDGHEVVCYDTYLTGNEKNLENLRNEPRFDAAERDVTKFVEFEADLDWVMHLASPASPVHYLEHPIHTLKVGALGTYNCLGLAKAKGASFFMASTSEIYGDPLVHPQPESYWGNVNTIGPRGVYDEAKRFAEAITFAYHRDWQIPIRLVRIFNTYGPRMSREDGRAVPNFISQSLKSQPVTVYGDGMQTRSLCYVTDLIEGFIRLLEYDGAARPFNLGNPHEVTILDIAKRVKDLVGTDSEIVFEDLPVDDPKQRCPDITAASEILGWEPKIPLDEGLELTVEWCRTNWA